MPEISIILPTYNPDIICLKRCVESVLNSTFQDFELIIIDDGSEDVMRAEIEFLAREDPRIILARQENGGVSQARNNGILQAKGNYLVFIDDDDYISPYFMEQSLSIAKKTACDLVMGGVLRSTIDTKTKKVAFEENAEIISVLQNTTVSGYSYEMLGCVREISNNAYISRGPVAKLYRTGLKGLFFPEDIRYGEDLLCNLEILQTASKIVLVDAIWYVYTINPRSASRRYNPEAMYEAELLIEKVRKIIPLDTPENIRNNGDFVFYELREVHKRWFGNPESSLSKKDNFRLLKKMAQRDPWRTLLKKEYLHSVGIKRKIGCELFRFGLISVVWKWKASMQKLLFR